MAILPSICYQPGRARAAGMLAFVNSVQIAAPDHTVSVRLAPDRRWKANIRRFCGIRSSDSKPGEPWLDCISAWPKWVWRNHNFHPKFCVWITLFAILLGLKLFLSISQSSQMIKRELDGFKTDLWIESNRIESFKNYLNRIESIWIDPVF